MLSLSNLARKVMIVTSFEQHWEKNTMDRTTALENYRKHALQERLLEVMEVFQPGCMLEYGQKKHEDLVALTACYLATEYQALTGHPIVEMLHEPPQPTGQVPQGVSVESGAPQPIQGLRQDTTTEPPATTTSDDALPLS